MTHVLCHLYLPFQQKSELQYSVLAAKESKALPGPFPSHLRDARRDIQILAIFLQIKCT